MKRKFLSVLALSSVLAFSGIAITSCSNDTTSETEQNATNVVISGAKDMMVGDTLQLVANFDREGEITVSWASTNQIVASVSQTGIVTAHDTGKTTIIAQVQGTEELVQASVTIEVRRVDEVAPEYVKATFVDEDGTVLFEDIVEYGGTPAYTVKNPQKVSDSQNSYAFSGWDKEIGPITADTTYKAIYEAIPLTNFAFEVDLPNGGYRVAGYNGTGDLVEIPETFSFRKVVSIGEEAFLENLTIKEVKLPETIVEIGASAFMSCANLETINLPKSIRSFGVDAFNGCSSLRGDFVLGDEVTIIPENCFYACYNLQGISGNNIKEIHRAAFTNCHSLVFDFKNGLERIEGFAFQHNKVMSDIILPDSVTFLGQSVFCHCTTLSTLTLPRNLETIECSNDVYGFQSLTLGCTSLYEVNIADDAPNFKVDENKQAVYSKDGKFLYFVVANRFGDYEILEGTEVIGPTAFYGVNGKNVVIPGSVIDVQYNAFWTANITGITFEEGEKDITLGYQLFNDCKNLKTMVVNRNIPATPSYFCQNLESLTTVVLPEGVEKIADYSFQNCSSLTELIIPSTVKEIGQYALSGTGITRFALPEGVEKLGNLCFGYSPNLEEIILPSTLKEIGTSCFIYDSGLTSINLPEGLEIIGQRAFRGTNIKNLKIPGSVKFGTSHTYAFQETESLEEVIIDEGVTLIPNYTFQDSAVKKVTMGNTVTKLGTYVFSGCAGLEEITLSSALSGTSNIGNYCFQECTALKTITFGPGLSDTELDASWTLKFGTNALRDVKPTVINFRGSEATFAKVDFNNKAFEDYLKEGTVTINYNYGMEVDPTVPVEEGTL